MTRYFFDLHDDFDVIDEEGAELPDLDAARLRSIREVREMACASIKDHGHIDLRHRIDIRTDDKIVCSVRFEDAVRIKRGGKPV